MPVKFLAFRWLILIVKDVVFLANTIMILINALSLFHVIKQYDELRDIVERMTSMPSGQDIT